MSGFTYFDLPVYLCVFVFTYLSEPAGVSHLNIRSHAFGELLLRRGKKKQKKKRRKKKRERKKNGEKRQKRKEMKEEKTGGNKH